MKRSRHLLVLLSSVLLGSSCSPGGPSGPTCEEPAEPGGHWEALLPPPSTVAPGTLQALVKTWTGEELLIWGRPGDPKEVDGEIYRPNAAAYAPVTGTWRDITPYGSGYDAVAPGAVWTGKEWILWGGELVGSSGERLASAGGVRIDPASGQWRAMSPAPIAARVHPSAVWTGKEVLFWGGSTADFQVVLDGAAYEPGTDSWRVLGVEGLVVPPDVEVTPPGAWSGERALFWDWTNTSEPVGLQYDPEEDRWSPLPVEGAPRPSSGSLWTGQELLVWGYDRDVEFVSGGAYGPKKESWRRLSTRSAPAAGSRTLAGSRMFTWGDYGNGCRVGGIYDIETDTWSTFTSQGAPSLRYGHTLAWTGHSLLVFGGLGGNEGRSDQWLGGEFFPDP